MPELRREFENLTSSNSNCELTSATGCTTSMESQLHTTVFLIFDADTSSDSGVRGTKSLVNAKKARCFGTLTITTSGCFQHNTS
eukprot:scaffold6831_cov118-Skeletonema_menzelii.AAC.1